MSVTREKRQNGWANAIKGHGQRGIDPRLEDYVQKPDLDEEKRADTYNGDGIAARIIGELPDEALRAGFSLTSKAEGIGDMSESVVGALDDLDAMTELHKALILERLDGGSLIVVGYDDGDGSIGGLAEPVGDYAGVRWLMPYRRGQVEAGPLEDDTNSPTFGKPASWKVPIGQGDGHSATKVAVHASRCIVLGGAFEPGGKGVFGASILDRCWQRLSSFGMAHTEAAAGLRDANIAKYGLKGLAEVIDDDEDGTADPSSEQPGQAGLMTRLMALEYFASIFQYRIHDLEDEKIEHVTRTFHGVPEMLNAAAIALAATAGMPMTRLFQISPGGLGTGDDEDRRWRDAVSAYQHDRVRRPLRQLITAVAGGSEFGRALPDRWKIAWAPLYVPTENQISEARSRFILAICKAVEVGMVFDHEAAESMFGGGEFSYEIALDKDLRSVIAKARDADPLGDGDHDHEEPESEPDAADPAPDPEDDDGA